MFETERTHKAVETIETTPTTFLTEAEKFMRAHLSKEGWEVKRGNFIPLTGPIESLEPSDSILLCQREAQEEDACLPLLRVSIEDDTAVLDTGMQIKKVPFKTKTEPFFALAEEIEKIKSRKEALN